MTSNDDWGSNQKQILQKLESLPSETEFVSFPENSLYLRLNDKEEFKGIKLDNPIFDPIHAHAKKAGCLIHLGSVPMQDGRGQFNASVLLFPDGKREIIYRKMHLFDVEIAGHRAYRESDLYAHGDSPATFDWKGWKFGASICYDLRFSELYQVYAREKVDVILIPSAFTVPTGKAHWSILLRARAIESQCYVLAAAQAGKHSEKRETYGHSMIVDPWGEILGESKPGETLSAQLDKSKIASVRAQIPMESHRHPATKFPLR
jgi:deaminated glutathione amidase